MSYKSGNLGRFSTGDTDLGRQVKFTARRLVEITSRPCAIDERRGLEQSRGLSNIKICSREVFKQVLEGMVIEEKNQKVYCQGSQENKIIQGESGLLFSV